MDDMGNGDKTLLHIRLNKNVFPDIFVIYHKFCRVTSGLLFETYIAAISSISLCRNDIFMVPDRDKISHGLKFVSHKDVFVHDE